MNTIAVPADFKIIADSRSIVVAANGRVGTSPQAMYGPGMQRERIKWRTDRGARNVKLVDQIRDSISRLGAEDLLDLHDIFAGDVGSPLERLAAAEMARRDLRP